MTLKTQHHAHPIFQSRKSSERNELNHTGNMNMAILEEMLINFDRTFEQDNPIEDSADETFERTEFDIEMEANEFLQTRIPQFSDRHPHEQ